MAMEGFENIGDIAVQVADFTSDGADNVGLIDREVFEGLFAFGVLDLESVFSQPKGKKRPLLKFNFLFLGWKYLHSALSMYLEFSEMKWSG